MASLLEEKNSANSCIAGKLIVDLYPDATVLFGNIVYFTE